MNSGQKSLLLSTASTMAAARALPAAPKVNPTVEWRTHPTDGLAQRGYCTLSEIPWDMGRLFGNLFVRVLPAAEPAL